MNVRNLPGGLSRVLAGARSMALGVLLALAASPAMADGGEFVENQLVVRLRAGASVSAFNARYQSSSLDAVASRNIHLLAAPPGLDAPGFADLVAGDPDLLYADLNFLAGDVSTDPSGQSIFVLRSKPQFDSDPAIRIIGAPGAQRLSTGQGVTVAVIDTGVDVAHPHLSGRIAPGQFSFITNNANVADVGDGLDNNNDGRTDEFVGHGTMVAGLVLRVAPDALVLPIRVMDSDGGTNVFRVIEGVFYAVDLGVDVINLSLGTLADPTVLRDAVGEAQAAGVVVVAAAGNEDQPEPRYPAGLGDLGAIAVGAVDNAGVRPSWSNFGPWVTLSAPGVEVISAVPNNRYGSASGTSFAAPLVAGAAALVRSACPALPVQSVRDMLVTSAVPIDHLNPGYEGLLGSGRLSVSGALRNTYKSPRLCPGLFKFRERR